MIVYRRTAGPGGTVHFGWGKERCLYPEIMVLYWLYFHHFCICFDNLLFISIDVGCLLAVFRSCVNVSAVFSCDDNLLAGHM